MSTPMSLRSRSLWILGPVLPGTFLFLAGSLLMGPSQMGLLLTQHVVAAPADTSFLGLGSKTLGGRFTWSDEVVFHNWRIQKHVVIGHYRLIDGQDQRHARGSLETCLAKLDEIKQEKKIPPMPPAVVIVLHGLGANRQMMSGLADFLEKKGALTVVNVGYPSTMASIDEHALSLASIIEHLAGVREISFVAHSMGNLVIRHTLKDFELLTPAARPSVQFKRFVMIAPPNHGASMADNFADSKLAQAVAGVPLQQLAANRKWPELAKRLAVPKFEFGIIAGGTGGQEGYLLALPGDDDGMLTVKTTKLAGASDFVVVKGIHQLLPQSKQVQLATLRFLKYGYFIAPEKRHPLPAVRPSVAGKK